MVWPGLLPGRLKLPGTDAHTSGFGDSLSPEEQLWARLWETAPPLCSWGMSLTVAPSGTWTGGEQRLGFFSGRSRGRRPAPQPVPTPNLVVLEGVESLPVILGH